MATLDAVTTDQAAAASASFPHITGAGSNRGMVFAIAFNILSGQTCDAASYNSVALTFHGGVDDGGRRVEFWKLANPASGSNLAAVTFSASTNYVIAVVSATDVNQSAVLGILASGTGFSGFPSISVVGAANDLILDCLNTVNTLTATEGAGQTERWDLIQGSGAGASHGAGSTEAGAVSVTMSWTLSGGGSWALAGAAIQDVGGDQVIIWSDEGA